MNTAIQPVVHANEATIADAASIVTEGGLVVFPTETVYGLGADATNDSAVAAIYAAKDRPEFNPLIVHVPDTETAAIYVHITDLGQRLIDAFWPGPLTLVLPRREDCALSRLVSAGLDTVAIRAPSHPIGRALLVHCGLPIAAPSANRSGNLSPTMALHAAQSLPGPDDGGPKVILDAGPCSVGLESTVVDATGTQPAILRPGGITSEQIIDVVGPTMDTDPGVPGQPKSPGMSARHYAPQKPLRLNAEQAAEDEALLGFGSEASGAGLNLSPTGNTTEAAANLFAMLHELDKGPAPKIAVTSIPNKGLGVAINDRLKRAVETGADHER